MVKNVSEAMREASGVSNGEKDFTTSSHVPAI